MGWEMRGNCGPYYTRSKRVNGRVVREYIGKGRIAMLVAQLDELDREKREIRATELKVGRDSMESISNTLDKLQELTDLLVKATLIQAGYYRHKRGEWRRRRGQK
jgi:flagellar biosynthesis/type III secretory pathway chaperone